MNLAPACGKLRFSGVEGLDVYNITAPFEHEGSTVVAGRVERREVEESSIVFFTQAGGGWSPVEGAPVLRGLQDPCVTKIGGDLVVGGVRFPIELSDGTTGWRMEFFRGRTLHGLQPFLAGPERMKDIRLKELADGRVALFSRPQGGRGGRGKIGFAVADGLDRVDPALILRAPLFEGMFPQERWGGANEAHLLEDGTLGVLGHVAHLDEAGGRHYLPMAFRVEPRSGEATSPKVLARRSDFPPGPAKRPDLEDVIFSGGLVRHGRGEATLYAGLSDVEAGWLRIPDPFA